ncbi:MAG TPA: hypothetical protein VKU44_00825 [Terriglobia bacterium]|nr:hypothetical protein [Terriglobia bacterium]
MKWQASVGYALILILLSAFGPGWAQSPTPSAPQTQKAQSPVEPEAAISQPSLGEVARRLKAERVQAGLKPVKVFTNDNLPSGPGGVSVIGTAPSSAAQGQPLVEALGTAGSAHGEAYYARRAAKLRGNLDLHQRELWVLQQKLNLAGPQYYPDPNRALAEQYSRSEINKLNQEIDEKKQQLDDDQKAIDDLRAALQREGGDIGWLRPGAVAGAAATGAEGEAGPGAEGPEAQAAVDTQAYWQARFKAARQRLKHAQEEQQLAEDELTLLQTRQATESSEDAQSGFAVQIPAKQTEVAVKRAATAKAQEALDALEQEFRQSGAPEEWSKAE